MPAILPREAWAKWLGEESATQGKLQSVLTVWSADWQFRRLAHRASGLDRIEGQGTRLYGVGSLLAGANADCLAYGTNKNLSVPDLVSAGRVLEGFHCTLDQRIVHDDLDN